MVGPDSFSSVSAKLVSQIMVGKFVKLSELSSYNLVYRSQATTPTWWLACPASMPKKPKQHIKEMVGRLEAFSVHCLILTSHFPTAGRTCFRTSFLFRILITSSVQCPSLVGLRSYIPWTCRQTWQTGWPFTYSCIIFMQLESLHMPPSILQKTSLSLVGLVCHIILSSVICGTEDVAWLLLLPAALLKSVQVVPAHTVSWPAPVKFWD